MLSQHEIFIRQSLIVFVTAVLATAVAFKFTQFIKTTIEYDVGVALIFLPAGMKLIATLTGGLPALAGSMVVYFFMSFNYLPTDQWTHNLAYVFICAGVTYGSVRLSMRRLRIDDNLENIGLFQLIALDFIVNAAHSLSVNLFFLSQDFFVEKPFLHRFLGMLVGDFNGTMLTFIILIGLTKVIRRFQDG
jgi:hypothetical protein